MNFNKHSELINQHAFLSPSGYHWLNYSDEKLYDVYRKHLAVKKGTELHELAAKLIELGVKLPKSKKTLNMYVNDAIGFKMQPEQILYYSDNCFGTADAISFKKQFLRIHDLKTGSTPTHIEQLEIYAALYCLEYKVKPSSFSAIDLRIYQNGEVLCHNPENDDILVGNPTKEDILPIMNKIIIFDRIIEEIKEGE